MGYREAYEAARRPAFAVMLEMALVKVALDVIAEASTTTNHAARAALAKLVLNDPVRYVGIVGDAVAVQGVTAESSTDQDFYNAVSAVWNGYAG